MHKKEPLTEEEVSKASEKFFPLFNVVLKNMPEGSSIEDALKVMETVCKLAHKTRADENTEGPFGFNKTAIEGQK